MSGAGRRSTTTDPVERLIELGRDGEAADLAVRQAGAHPTMGGHPVGPLDQLDVLVPNFNRLVAGAGDALDRPTPCEGWAVRDLLAHVNGGARMFAAAYTGEAVHERGLEDGVAEVVEEALREFVEVVKAPGALDRIVQSPFGAMPGEAFARLAALDLLVHTWDLSKALGVADGVPAAVVGAVDGFARQAISDDLRTPGVFGAEVVATDGASPIDALAAFTGRRL